MKNIDETKNDLSNKLAGLSLSEIIIPKFSIIGCNKRVVKVYPLVFFQEVKMNISDPS